MNIGDLKKRRELLRQGGELLTEHMEVLAETGRALRQIRDAKLYHDAGYRSMGKFCLKHYAMTKKAWEGLIEIAGLRDVILDTVRLREATEEQ